MEEIEVKFLNIDPEFIQKKLKNIGAEKIGEYFYKRQTFDYPDFRMDKNGSWIRLRDEGERITLCFKQRQGIQSHDGSTSDTGMEEIEFEVEDFNKASLFLKKIGLIEKGYQENKRIRWMKDDVEFDLDFWPRLSPYLEIEAKRWDKIDRAIKLLGLNPEERKIFSANQVYKLNGIDVLEYTRITFEEFVKRK